MDIFEFIAPNGYHSKCGVTIVHEDKTVILTELPENIGMSVTNASEIIATGVYHNIIRPLNNGWFMNEITWVEFYPEHGTFDQIKYQIETSGNDIDKAKYCNPTWEPWLSAKDFMQSFEF